MVTRILTLVRVRTAPAAIAGQCSSSTQNTHNQNYRRLFNDDEKIILPAAAASAVEAKKEDDKPGDLNRGDSQLREAEATHHAASQRKRQCSESEGEDVVPKKTARKKHRKLCSTDGCKSKSQRGAVVKDAQINLIEEECAPDMEQRWNYAAAKDARVLLETEECVLNLGQRKSYAVAMDAQVKLKREACVGDMGQRGSFAALKDARAILEQEESVTCMQRSNDRRYDYENS
ncbi:hypothetical protein QTG54_016573, partial [Skeletonema marinoi]